MAAIRNFLRNVVLTYLPPKIAHQINMWKNVHLSTLEPEMRIVSRLIRPGTTVIDIGANLGLYSEIFARTAGKVLAFEPQPDLAQYIRRVLPGKVVIVEMALSSKDGTAELRIPRFAKSSIGQLDAFATIEKNNAFEAVTHQSVDIIHVPIRRLDDVGRDHGSVSFIKIDVEGHENDVISGARALLAEHRPVLMIEIEPRHNSASYGLFDVLAEAGFVAGFYDGKTLRRITKAEAAKAQDWDLATNTSTLAVSQANLSTHVANFFFIHDEDDRLAMMSK